MYIHCTDAEPTHWFVGCLVVGRITYIHFLCVCVCVCINFASRRLPFFWMKKFTSNCRWFSQSEHFHFFRNSDARFFWEKIKTHNHISYFCCCRYSCSGCSVAIEPKNVPAVYWMRLFEALYTGRRSFGILNANGLSRPKKIYMGFAGFYFIHICFLVFDIE